MSFLNGIYMDKLECIKLFSHVARLKSFTAAANELNMTQGSVSKKIAWLEQSLGFALFNRNSRQISITDAGSHYLSFSYELIEKLDITEKKLKNELDHVVGKLRISSPSAFATERLAKPIQKFMAINPDITIDISVNDKQVDLFTDDIDIAIRAAFLKDSRLKAKKLLEHELCYFASPTYLEKYGNLSKPFSFSAHKCITYNLTSPSNVWRINNEKFTVNQAIQSDCPEMIVKMALLGCGIAAMPKWMIQKYLDNSQLVELFSDSKKYSLPMYIVYKDNDYQPLKIRAFIDFLTSYFDSTT